MQELINIAGSLWRRACGSRLGVRSGCVWVGSGDQLVAAGWGSGLAVKYKMCEKTVAPSLFYLYFSHKLNFVLAKDKLD